MIYFTSDPHFGHSNIIRYVNRPFRSVEEMDEILINNFNNVVDKNDTLYILGDFTMGGSYTKCMKYRKQLNCKHIHLIYGNHDKHFLQGGKESPYETERDYFELKYNGTRFCLSHYPFISWHGREQGAIMLHGHIHSKRRSNEINQCQQVHRFDVGVDANDYKPVSIDDILKFFNTPLEEIFD